MQDCDLISTDKPIRQGDVLKQLRNDSVSVLFVVISADCDIANNKLGDAGLSCVQVTSLHDYVLNEYAASLAQRQLKKSFTTFIDWINKIRLAQDAENIPLSTDRAMIWLLENDPEVINQELKLNSKEYNNLQTESTKLRQAHSLINSPQNVYSALDSLCILKNMDRPKQLKQIFSSLNSRNLPLDIFFISSIPDENNLGFIAKLKSLSFIPETLVFTSMMEAKEHDNSFLRVGRLKSTFQHAIAQQFGILFSRIGFPESYENDRDETFSLVEEQIKKDMEKKNDLNCNN
jgi:hypothetical protein